MLPSLTTVLSLLFDVKSMGVFKSDGMSHIMRIAASASTEPKRNGGPGRRCFKNKSFFYKVLKVINAS